MAATLEHGTTLKRHDYQVGEVLLSLVMYLLAVSFSDTFCTLRKSFCINSTKVHISPTQVWLKKKNAINFREPKFLKGRFWET